MDCNTTKGVAQEDKEWMAPIMQFIQNGDKSGDDDPIMRKKAFRFMLIGEELYRQGFSNPLLKCVTNRQAQYIIEELHTRICGLHSRPTFKLSILLADCERRLRQVR